MGENSIERKNFAVEYSKSQRKELGKNRTQIPKKYLFFNLILIPVLLFTGFLIGLPIQTGVNFDNKKNTDVKIIDSQRKVFTENILDNRETGWCVYGIEKKNRYVISDVDWTGEIGSSDSVSFGCKNSDDFLGRVHNHPVSGKALLSEEDMSNFFSLRGMKISGVAVNRDSVVKIRWFTRNSLRQGIETNYLPY